MAAISPSVPIMSLSGIYRSSSLFWLRRRTCCSASVPVTGGSVSAELLHRQLDLVTGIAALLAVDMRERAPFARALGVAAGQAQDLESFWEAIIPKPAVHATRVSASRPNSFSPCAEPPPRPRTAAAAPPAVEVEVLRH